MSINFDNLLTTFNYSFIELNYQVLYGQCTSQLYKRAVV